MAVAGNFPDVSFPDLIQFYCMSKKTVAIRVTSPELPGGSGEYYVGDGELLDAKSGESTGVEAFYRALQIHHGSFEVQVDVRPPTRSIHVPLNEALLEGMTRLDEARNSGPRLATRDILEHLEEAFHDPVTQPPITAPLTQPGGTLGVVVADGPEADAPSDARRRRTVGLVIALSAVVLGGVCVAAIGLLRPALKPPAEAGAPAPTPVDAPTTASAAGTPASAAAAAPTAPASSALASPQGVTDASILLGMAGPFSGPAKELGRQTRVGIEVAFAETNAAGGVHGRTLALAPEDDAFDPAKAVGAMRALWEKKKVFGYLGNVGASAAAGAPFAVERRALLFGAFSGASALRRDPPDRYVFNYRASESEETAAVFKYLISARALRPEQIAVLTEDDATGDAGFEGVAKVLRQLRRDPRSTLRVTYPRNTIEVDAAVARVRAHAPAIRAVVMVVPYRPAARFIEKMRETSPGVVFTNVSSVGANALAEELLQSGPGAAEGVIVTQVVPPLEGQAPAVDRYKAALAKFAPDERPDPVSFEAWLSSRLLLEGLNAAGRSLDTEKLVDALESLKGVDLGTGNPVTLGASEHQASHRVWGTLLDARGRAQPLPLD